jgi:hypothetical protein
VGCGLGTNITWKMVSNRRTLCRKILTQSGHFVVYKG